MKSHLLCAAFVAVVVSGAAQAAVAEPGTVAITFSGLTPAQGHLAVQLCTADEFVRYICHRHMRPKVEGDQITVLFEGVPAGRYAVTSFQDINDDSKIGRDMLGRPTEPWGYSGAPEFLMGPPSFDSVAVDIPASGAVLSIQMTK